MQNSSLPAMYPVLPGLPSLTRGDLTLPLLRRNPKGPSRFLTGHSMGHPLRQQIQGGQTSKVHAESSHICHHLWSADHGHLPAGPPPPVSLGLVPMQPTEASFQRESSPVTLVFKTPICTPSRPPQGLSWGLRLHCLPQTPPRWVHPSPASPPRGAFSARALQWQLPPQPAISPQPALPCLQLPDVRHWLFVRNVCLPTRI